jgi:hypothetical protein
MSNVKIETELEENENILISRKLKKNECVPAYICIGGNIEYSTKEKGYPKLISVLKDLSKISTWFLWTLVENRNSKTNICFYKAKDIYESKNISRAYKELNTLSIIKRIQKQYYMINPKVIFPIKGEYKNTLEKWDNLS